jgi:hypothetical protein
MNVMQQFSPASAVIIVAPQVYRAERDCVQLVRASGQSESQRKVIYTGANFESNNVGLDESIEVVLYC